MDPTDSIHSPVNPREINAFFHDDESSSSDGSTVSSSSVRVHPPAATDIVLTTPPPDRTVQAPPALPPSSASAPGPDSDEDDEEMPDLYIPALIAPTMFLPIPNVRLSIDLVALRIRIEIFLLVFLDRPFVYVTEQIYLAREETHERLDRRVAENRFSFVGRELPYPERTVSAPYTTLGFELRVPGD